MRNVCYPETNQQVTDPLYINECPDCKSTYWSLLHASKCLNCGSEKITSIQANKK